MQKLLNVFNKLFAPLAAINRYVLLSFGISFFVCFAFLLMIFGRYYCVSNIKTELLRLESSLNDWGWDIAYDDLQFKTWWPMDLLKIKNLKIYRLSEKDPFEWNIPEFAMTPNFFSCGNLRVKLSSAQDVRWNGGAIELNIPKSEFSLRFSKEDGFQELLLDLKDMEIKDWAKISELRFATQRMAPRSLNDRSPFLENHLLIKDVVFDAQREIPLTDKIEKIYLNANMIGTIKPAESYRESIYEWLAVDGRIDIRSLIISWKPLLLVGRGDLYFDEKLQPKLQLSTSSKALLPVLDLLERHHLIDRKGVFVTKILLANKSFKMSPLDEYSTVVTPISYKDQKLSVENITIQKF